MKKTNLLLFIFLMLASNIYAQKKTFSTKQAADSFMVETMKKLIPLPFRFIDYADGVILFKNPATEKIEEDVEITDATTSLTVGEKVKKIKCNVYSKIYLNKIESIKIDTLTCTNNIKCSKYSFIGKKIGENGYMPVKSFVGINKQYRNVIVFLDKTEGSLSEREGLLFMGDTDWENNFLEAAKVYLKN